jgi:hypothetical protein
MADGPRESGLAPRKVKLAYSILALVVLQRLVELVYASRNTRALKAQGAIEYGRPGQEPPADCQDDYF